MGAIDDESLREDVNNALNQDEDFDDEAEHDQDDIADDESPEDEGDDDQDDDDSVDDESDEDRSRSGKSKSRSAPADDNDSEEDDDPSLDYARPEFTPTGSAQVKPFDISTLPRKEDGTIDPAEANRLINEHYAKQGQASQQQEEQLKKTTDLLTQQWTRVSKKYPLVYQNPRLRDIARDMHLNSIGTDRYLTPAQAAAEVEKTRKSLVKTGYKSAKTRRSVEKMTRTERNSGRPSSGKLTDYEAAKKLAGSRDPAKAKQGRMQMLRIRRQARAR